MGYGISNSLKNIFSPNYIIAVRKRKKIERKYRHQHLIVGLNSSLTNTLLGNYVYINKGVSVENSFIGNHTYINSNTNVRNTNIGKFCSIGSNIQFGLGKHPTNMVSTHPAFFANNKIFKTYSDKVYIDEYENITVGNDVWIGDGAVIMNGVSIEDGAVIAARAVVTKDVKAYSIVGGVPAKLLKMRFDENTINEIVGLKWWDWEEEKISENFKKFHNPEDFIKFFS